jgi:lipopolysaccharide transport protein LptA
VFSGNVKAMQGGVTLLADTLTVDYLAQDKAGGKASRGHGIENLVAEGTVKIVRDAGPDGREEATGTKAVYTPAQNQIVLTGPHVVLTRGPSMLEGDRLEYDMASGNAHVTNSKGPVKARFVPEKAATQK